MFRVGVRCRVLLPSFLLVLLLGLGSVAVAQASKPDTDQASSASQGQGSQADQQTDPLKRPITEKQKKQNAKSLKVELSKTYKKAVQSPPNRHRTGSMVLPRLFQCAFG